MNYGPTKMLTLAHPAFAGTDGTANKLSDVFTWTVPQGLGWVFPGRHPLVLKLRSAASTELPDTAEIYLFQSLIGRLRTKRYMHLEGPAMLVSIPHR